MFNKRLEYIKAIFIAITGLLLFLSAPSLTAFALKWYEDTRHTIIIDGVKIFAISDRVELFLWALGLWAIVILFAVTLYVSIYAAKRISKTRNKAIDLVLLLVAVFVSMVLLIYGLMLMESGFEYNPVESIVILVSCFFSVLGGIASYKATGRIYGLLKSATCH